MDEATHLTRSQEVWQGKPFDLLLTGKALGPYLAALFDPFSAAPWIGRYVIVLVGSIGLASIIALGRALHSRQAGLLAGVLWLLCPYLFFFERMALVDATVASFATLSALLAVRMIRTGGTRDAILCGVALALCVFAKTTGIVFLVIPTGTAILLPGITRRNVQSALDIEKGWGEAATFTFQAITRDVRVRLRQVIITYVVALVLLIVPSLYIWSQSANVFGIGTLASDQTSTLSERLAHNIETAWNAYHAYFHPLFWAFLLFGMVMALGLQPRRALLLAMLSIIPLAVLILTATQLYLRYLVITLPGLLALAAVGFVSATQFSRWRRPLPWLAVGVWAVLFTLPFMSTAFADPGQLALPTSDRYEYLDGWTAGFGLREAADELIRIAHAQNAPLTAIGLVSSCNTLRLYVPDDGLVTIHCPDVWDGTGYGITTGRQLIRAEANKSGAAYAIGEIGGPVYESAVPLPRQALSTYGRPDADYSVVIYRVFP